MITPHGLLFCVVATSQAFAALAPASGAKGNPPPAVTLRAVDAFVAVTGDGWVPPYAETRSSDSAEHGLAINTVRHQGAPAAVEVVYQGPAGRFDLTLLAVAEEDGESRYQVVINGKGLAEAVNPPSAEKRLPVYHRWPAVDLAPGDHLRVVFRGHSNGRVPERGGFAWARARWRSLTLTPPPTP